MTIDAATFTIYSTCAVCILAVCLPRRDIEQGCARCINVGGNYDNGIWHELLTITLILRGLLYICTGYYGIQVHNAIYYVAAVHSSWRGSRRRKLQVSHISVPFVCSQTNETLYRRRPSRSGWTSIWKRWDRFANSRILARRFYCPRGVFSVHANLVTHAIVLISPMALIHAKCILHRRNAIKRRNLGWM